MGELIGTTSNVKYYNWRLKIDLRSRHRGTIKQTVGVGTDNFIINSFS